MEERCAFVGLTGAECGSIRVLHFGYNHEFINPNAAEEQIKELAQFIIDEVPGEPSRSEGAVECAIRIIRQFQKACGWMGCLLPVSAHHDHSAVVKCEAPCVIGHPFGGWAGTKA